MLAIINRNKKFGMLNGVITLNDTIRDLVYKCLKAGKATKLVDTNETLMYRLTLPIE